MSYNKRYWGYMRAITQANIGLRVLYACASEESRDRAAKELREIIERINYPVKVRKVKNGVRLEPRHK